MSMMGLWCVAVASWPIVGKADAFEIRLVTVARRGERDLHYIVKTQPILILPWSSRIQSLPKTCRKNIKRFLLLWEYVALGFPSGSDGKESTYNVRDLGSIPGLRRSLGGGHSNPLQYSYLKNTMDRGAWQAVVHGVTKSQMTEWNTHSLSLSHTHSCFTILYCFCCAGKWMSSTYACLSTLLDFLPIEVTTVHYVEFLMVYSRVSFVICFIHGGVYMSIAISQFFPLLLPCLVLIL